MHVSAILIYDNGFRGNHRIHLDDLREIVTDRLGRFPLFRRKLLHVPVAMDNHYWVDAGKIRPEQHISESNLAKDSDWRDFQDQLATLHQQQLDLRIPLWQMVLINNLKVLPGMTGHYQALFIKTHHAAVDGMSLAMIIKALHQPGGVINDDAPSPEAPDPWSFWTRMSENSFDRSFRIAGAVGKVVKGLKQIYSINESFQDLPPINRSAALFNNNISSKRSTGAIVVGMDDIVRIKRKVGRVTINDIATAIISGALRSYLSGLGCLPDKNMACAAPINLRRGNDEQSIGNRIGTMIMGLATTEADPLARLKLAHRYALAGKKRADALGTGTIMDISDSLHPGLLSGGIRTYGLASRIPRFPVPFHTMVSNVMTPAEPMQLRGAQLLVPLGLGPLRDNLGLFHIISNGPGLMSIAFNACRQLLPDPGNYERCLYQSFRELGDAKP